MEENLKELYKSINGDEGVLELDLNLIDEEVEIKKRKLSKIQQLAKTLKKDWMLYVLVVPIIIWYIAFLYKPMYGLQIAFKKFSIFRGIAGSPWVGLENFKEFMSSPYFLRSLKNTFMISFTSLLVGFSIPILLALMFNEVKNEVYKRGVQTLTYLPHFISVVVIAGIVKNFLAPSNGIINILISMIGLEKTYFLTKPEWFRTIYIGSNIWKEAGFGSIVYIAALAGINPSLYEASRIDGASRLQQIWHVSIPGILPTIVIMFIMRIGKLLDVGYELILLLYQPATYETADVLSTYIYRTGLQSARYDIATAAGLFNAVIGFTLVFLANRLSRRLTATSLW